jgi:hypothetical protein
MMMQHNSSPGLRSLFAATAKSNGLLLVLTVGKIRNSANSKLVPVECLAACFKVGYRKGCYLYVASRCKSKTRLGCRLLLDTCALQSSHDKCELSPGQHDRTKHVFLHQDIHVRPRHLLQGSNYVPELRPLHDHFARERCASLPVDHQNLGQMMQHCHLSGQCLLQHQLSSA